MKLFNNNIAPYVSTEGDKIYPIVVDIKKGLKSGEAISFVTADNQVGVITVDFMDGNSSYSIEGCMVTSTIHRPDGTVLEIPCDIISQSTIEIPLGINGTYQEGVHTFDLKIVRGNGKVIGVPTMSYSVLGSLSSDGVVEDDDRLPVLTMVLDNAQDRLSRLDKAIAGATNDLEVKEARDGEVSLSARLFRDLYGKDDLLKTTILEQEIQELYEYIGGGGNVDLSPIENRLERIEAEVGTYTESINTNKLNITSNTNAINLNAEGIATNADNIASNTNKIDEYKLLIDTNTANISNNTSKIDAYKSLIDTNTTNIASNTLNISTNTDNIASNTSKIDSYKLLIDANTDNIANNASKIDAYKLLIDNNTASIANINNSTNKIDEYKLLIDANTANINNNTNKIDEYKLLIDNNTASITNNTNKIDEYKLLIDANTANIEELESTVTSNTALINNAKADITGLTNIVNSCNSQVSGIRTELTELEGTVAGFNSAIESNTANIVATRGEISTKINSTKSELYSAISSVEGEVSTVNQRLTDTTVTLEGEIESVGEELDTLSENIPRLDNKISTLDRKVTDQSNNIANIVQSMQRIHYSTVEPTKSDGEDGDLWVIYGESTLFEQAVTLEETDFVVTDEYGTMAIPD